jgi:hypothetical protein
VFLPKEASSALSAAAITMRLTEKRRRREEDQNEAKAEASSSPLLERTCVCAVHVCIYMMLLYQCTTHGRLEKMALFHACHVVVKVFLPGFRKLFSPFPLSLGGIKCRVVYLALI